VLVQQNSLTPNASGDGRVPGPSAIVVIADYSNSTKTVIVQRYVGDTPTSATSGVEVRNCRTAVSTLGGVPNVVNPSNQFFFIHDYEMPILNGQVWYRFAYISKSSSTQSSWSSWQSITMSTRGWWLHSPQYGTQPIRIEPEAQDITVTYTRMQGRFVPLRSDRELIFQGPIRGAEVDLSVMTRTYDQYDELNTLLRYGTPLLLRNEANDSWFIQPGPGLDVTLLPTAENQSIRRIHFTGVEVKPV
jgi:hypothetical protein